MNKRGYFFLVDAVIASIILFVGIFTLFGGGVSQDNSTPPILALEDLLLSLGTQPIAQTLNPYYLTILIPLNLAPYPEATPLEQIVYLNYSSCAYCDEHAVNYTRSLFETTLPAELGAALYINGSLIYEKPAEQQYQFSRGFVVYARLNETVIIGPLVAELRLWGQ